MGCLCSKGTQFDDIKIPKIDPNRCGPDIRLGTNNRVAGRGTALCNTNVLQDRMYFECKIINPNGTFCIGLSGPDSNLAEMMQGFNGNNKKERAQTKWTFIFESDKTSEKFSAGDVVSVSYDQSDYPTILNFHLNGHDAPFKSITSVRGDMRPAISVSDEATLELVFDEDFFGQAPPHNFFPLMHAREMLSA